MIDALLDPTTVEHFNDVHYEKRPLHLGDGRDRVALLPITLDGLLRSFSDPRFAGGKVRGEFYDKNGNHRTVEVRAALASELMLASMTISFGRIDPVIPALATIAQKIKARLNYTGEIAFVAHWYPDGARSPLHFDAVSQFILPLSGRTSWRYATAPGYASPATGFVMGSVDSARRFASAHDGTLPKPPDETELSTCALAPGDLLYLPSGTWHQSQAEESSLVVSLTLRPLPLFQLVWGALCRRLMEHPEWRSGAPLLLNRDPNDGERARSLFAAQLTRLRETVGQLTVEELARLAREL